jgi:26S proteasome regulatory subunit N1
MVVERLTENDPNLWMPSLEAMRTLIRAATTSMTSVPKPLKFLRPHYATLKTIYEKIVEPNAKALCADILSVLAMTNPEGTECLQYRLFGSNEGLVEWGHEYVR